MGGGFALLAAPSGGFAAASVNYGVVPRDAPALLRGACPVVGTYGGRDRMLPRAAAKLEAALAANGVEHDVVEYAGASHSLLNDHDGRFLLLVDRVTGHRLARAVGDRTPCGASTRSSTGTWPAAATRAATRRSRRAGATPRATEPTTSPRAASSRFWRASIVQARCACAASRSLKPSGCTAYIS